MRILIAGGGTGGHLFPGIAVGEEFLTRNAQNRILFVGTDRGIEQRILPALGYDLKTITGAGLVGQSLLRKMTGAMQFLVGLGQAFLVIRCFRPDLVLGTGGYVSAPVLVSAFLLGKETGICEQNSVPGLTNRILGKLVKKIFIAFDRSREFFPTQKTYLTGNPVRKEFLAQVFEPRSKTERFGVLVLGGSQGAHSINQAMVEALPGLADLREKLLVIHQTGANDLSWVQAAYESKGFRAEISAFITAMATAYQRVQLVVGRAGATSLAEILICGKPSILIPYPYAAHNHQEVNARSVAEAGAGRVILNADLNGTVLGSTIRYFVDHPQAGEDMGRKARGLARPDAARAIVDHYDVVTGRR